MMDLWMTEWQTQHLGMSARIKETLFSGRSSFQEIAVVESEPFGRMLVLDGVFQTSLFDEFIYHEMMAHVSLSTHPNPERILIIGGGDGGDAGVPHLGVAVDPHPVPLPVTHQLP